MPSNGGVDGALLHYARANGTADLAGASAAIGKPEAYTADRLRHLARAGWLHQDRMPLTAAERREHLALQQRRRAEERAHRHLLAERARERREDQQELARMLREDLAQKRYEVLEQRRAVREDPHYGYLDWLHRTNTVYDRQTWVRTGRLVATQQKYTAGGSARRETVDWTDLLDRPAQEMGEDVHTFMRRLERLDKERQRAADLAQRYREEHEQVNATIRDMREAS